MTVPTDKKGTAKTVPVRAPKKLIEVALPLDDINAACAREKSIRHGHPSTLHLWWARRPLAAARAVLFAQLVNDPGYERSMIGGGQRGMNAKDAERERERLFGIIRRLVLWENTNNEQVLNEARAEIWKSWRETCELNKNHPDAAELFNPEKLPAFHDPFAGGGSIPLEAQRLGLEAYASDLNPVAVLINKAMIEIPPRFAGMPPVNSEARKDRRLFDREWKGAQGLAEDVRYYGKWMRDEAEKSIGHLYPEVEVTKEMAVDQPDLKPQVGRKFTVIAWIWSRTVRSPNPAFSHVHVPLASTFILSSKQGRETCVVGLVGEGGYTFTVRRGGPGNIDAASRGTKAGGSHSPFQCIMSGSSIPFEYIRAEGMAGRMGLRLMAVVADSKGGRLFLPPTAEMERLACTDKPSWRPETELRGKCRANVSLYGLDKFGDLFTDRQLVALTTFADLVERVRVKVHADASRGWQGQSVRAIDADEYTTAICTYLALAIDKVADYNSSLVLWSPTRDQVKTTFSRQALGMTWDFAETNIFAGAAGDLTVTLQGMVRTLGTLGSGVVGTARLCEAQTQDLSAGKVVSTDPPYYDNVAYADLSDFFYVWLRSVLRRSFEELFPTMAVPREKELVATTYRHPDASAAERFFLDGMTEAMRGVAAQCHKGFPVTIYYAFKQSESEATGDGGTSNTGWDKFLEAVTIAGLSISGTWPMRTERGARSVSLGTNALASSIVLVCRRREPDAATVSRREFIRELKEVLPEALKNMTSGRDHSPVAAVDLSQAIIGPGMAVFSKYAAVLEADGTPMTVKTALQLINRHLAGDDIDFDAPTRFCLGWFETHKWDDAKFGEADVLARSKGTSVDTVAATGVAFAKHGIVRLLKSADYPTDWVPPEEGKPPVWEALHHLIRAQRTIGIGAAGRLLAQFPTLGEPIRQLAYRLYTLCERNNDAEEARAYNELITSWPSILEAAQKEGPMFEQGTFL